MQMFDGVWPALITPSNEDGTVNLEALHKLVAYLLDKGVDGFYVGGSTGEGIFMPVAQRKLLAETVLAQIDGRVPTIVHAGAIAVDDAIDLARHANECGAVGISSVLPPLYDSMDSIAAYYRALAAATPDLPFIAYLLKPEIDTVALIQSLLDIPNLAGTKYTGSNMFEFRRLIDLGRGQWTMFSGMDEQCLYAAMMGATGNIGSTLNFMPGVYTNIHKAIAAGNLNEAQEFQVRANRVTEVMAGVGFRGAIKVVLSRLLDCDFGSPRLPGLPLTAEEQSRLWAELEATDYDELVAM
jgi:N-acetylneuraminate lyase